jgi:N-acyl-D-aspartate/D-glutamate deacylase
MTEHELVIIGGMVVDGRGADARRADVAIDDGRITHIGDRVGTGRRTIDAAGHVVAPGFVDVHTHFDVQGFWDPSLSPSSLHGVTTVIGGNCGFTVAPLGDADVADYLRRMLSRVEGMPLEALEIGVPWDWRSTADYLARLDGALAINAGFKVGHSALRRVVMGAAATERAATPEEVEQMADLLRLGLAAGALGFSSSWSPSHNDAEGRPVPSRWADASELVALAAVCGEYDGTSLEFIPGIGEWGDWDEVTKATMVDMTVAAGRPLNWNIITGSAANLDHWREKLAVSDRAAAAGGKIVGLAIPRVGSVRLSFRSGFVLDAIDGWAEPMALPLDEKIALFRDPEERARLGALAEVSSLGKLTDWSSMVVVETFSDETSRFEGRAVADIAAEFGKSAFDTLVDLCLNDDLRTSFRLALDAEDDADWEARASLMRDPRVVVGASDAGAHLDMIATFSFATDLLAHVVRDRSLMRLEEAVRLLTSVPAALYGLRDRGSLVPGAIADAVVLDPASVGAGEVHTRFDLPGGAGRLFADAIGIPYVIVNGTPIVDHGELAGTTPGTLLRSGRDTVTPALG